jgi:hypothetical protein
MTLPRAVTPLVLPVDREHSRHRRSARATGQAPGRKCWNYCILPSCSRTQAPRPKKLRADSRDWTLLITGHSGTARKNSDPSRLASVCLYEAMRFALVTVSEPNGNQVARFVEDSIR